MPRVGPSPPADRRAPPWLAGLRRAKRRADERFGDASRLVQFCAVGASGTVVDLAGYAALRSAFATTWMSGLADPVAGVPLDRAAAGAAAVSAALCWNFAMNRRVTFDDARHAATPARQFLNYALGNAVGIGLSLSIRLGLPTHSAFFRGHELAAAVVGVVAATGVSFTLARRLAFRAPANHPADPYRLVRAVDSWARTPDPADLRIGELS